MNYRAILLSLIVTFVLSPAVCYGEISSCCYGITSLRNGLRDGDILTRYPLSYADTVVGGEGCLWDLHEIGSGTPGKYEVKLIDDSLQRYRIVDRRTAMYYDCHSDTLFVSGHENSQWRLLFDQCEPWLPDSLWYGCGLSGPVHGRGIYCDRLRYAVRGNYHMSVDAVGTLILPEGDTLRNVERLHTERLFFHNYYPIDSISGDISYEEFAHAATEGNVLRHDTRRWYAPGYRYPILEVQTLTSLQGGESLMQQACYTPLSEIESLPSDPDNSVLRELLHLKNAYGSVNSRGDAAQEGGDMPGGGDDIRYSFSQNRDWLNVSVRYSVDKATDVEFILADVVGFVYSSDSRHCEPGEEYEITISYTSLPGNGPYALYICTDSNRYSEKFYK